MKLYSRILIPICCALVIVLPGCAETEVRMHTYPPDMVYMGDAEVESAMLRLSKYIWSINDIFDSNEFIAGSSREQIIDLLNQMENEAAPLGAGTRQTNHLLIDEHIDEFRTDVKHALRAVEEDPPNYYLAGRLSGSCLACHVRR